VHGSAPDIAGQGVANPLAMIGSLAMALRYSLGLGSVADALEGAVSDVLASGVRTRDIAPPGANAVGTREMGDAVLRELKTRLARA
jgi:3-isopropylmalate dehydrogenase